jgi:Fic family protein
LDYWIKGKTFSNQELAARFQERIETIHPFANGNGRFGRIITEQICRFHQYEIPLWGRKLQNNPAKRREAYITALTQARQTGDYSELIGMIFS